MPIAADLTAGSFWLRADREKRPTEVSRCGGGTRSAPLTQSIQGRLVAEIRVAELVDILVRRKMANHCVLVRQLIAACLSPSGAGSGVSMGHR